MLGVIKLIIILEDESVFLSFFFNVRPVKDAACAKRRLTKIFECLGEMITRLVKLN